MGVSRKTKCSIVQALVNVGRNYNGPKVLELSEEGSRKTGTVERRK